MSMTAHDPNLARITNGVRRWLGFGQQTVDDGPGNGDEQTQDGISRRRLLDDICGFLMLHRLEVNSFTLTIAHDAITGTDERLTRLIEERVAKQEPITLDWLEQACRHAGRVDGAAALDRLMARLESSLDEFSKTTHAARSATSEYSDALESHVGELEQISKAGVVISELAGIAKAMLDRTRSIEREMRRGEMQTRTLQRNLEEARRNADSDHLTGLPNRGAFEKLLHSEHEAAVLANEPLCVAFCDIDHFKRINDTHGHEAGDRVLKAVAKTLARISNDKCHVARHGGEEFAILFRGKTVEEVWDLLDTARAAMAVRRLVNRTTDVPFGRVTFSGGIADAMVYTTLSQALKAADDALYAAKNGGRNRIAKAGEAEITAAA